MSVASNPRPRAAPARGRGELLRLLGVGFGLAVIVGNTIGAGILRAPGEIATHLPNVWWFFGIWVAGGLYALLGAASLAELGTMLPRSGGQYVFARHALGPYAGFVVGWSDWLSTCGTTAAVSLVIGESLGLLLPPFAGHALAIAITITVGFALLQWRGLAWGSRAQELTSLLKGLGFLVLVAACFLMGGRAPHAADAAGVTPHGTALLAAIALSLQAVIYTYDGWSGVVYFSEEVRQPAQDIPRSLCLGVLTVIGIYLLVNLAFVYVLPLSRIAGSELAAGVAARMLWGAHGDMWIRILTIVSLLSGINAYHLMATRVLFAMSRDGLVTTRAARVNAGGTPTVALALGTVVAVAFIAGARAFGTLIALLAFFFVANYTLTFTSLFVLRRREPDAPRPYRAWGYPWTTGLALLGSVAFLASALLGDTRHSVRALLLLAASYPVYRLAAARKR